MVMVCVARWLNISNVIRFFPECFCTMNLFLSAPNRILSLGELNSWMNLFKSIHCQNDDNFFILFRPRFSARISNRNSHNSNDTINGNAWGISHMNEWSFHTRHTPRCFYMSCSFGTWKQTEIQKWISIHALNTQMFDDRLPNCLLVNRRILLKSSTHTLERAHQYMRVCRHRYDTIRCDNDDTILVISFRLGSAFVCCRRRLYEASMPRLLHNIWVCRMNKPLFTSYD